MTATERFLHYITFSTASDEESDSAPSTARQLELSRALGDELGRLGLRDVQIDACGNVIATLPASAGVAAPALALIAHVDTSPAASGENVRARIVRYEGADIPLGHGQTLSAAQTPALRGLVGQELIVTDGSTLLGADDKAGVAEIMTMAELLLAGDQPHGELRLVFTTDEEVGRGVDGLDVAALGCRWGYTVDGGELGCYEYENFNAAAATVTVHGVGIHPGEAKDVMRNAAVIAMELHALLPPEQVPERTSGYEGFIHLTELRGDVVEARLQYIIRDHDMARFEEKKAALAAAVEEIRRRYGPETAELTLRDTYYNMKEKILPHRQLLDRVEDAFRACGVTPRAMPIRGGTDGARLSWEGLPCPNLSTGGFNYHGVHEFIPVAALETMPRVLCRLAASFARGASV